MKERSKMELYSQISCFTLVILFLTSDVFGLILAPSKSADKAVFGDNTFTLTCAYTLEANERLYYLQLKRQRQGQADPLNIIFFNDGVNATYQTPNSGDLSSRTVATPLTNGQVSGFVQVEFSSITCVDKATYYWEANYFTGSGGDTKSKDINVPVTAISTFVENIPPVFSPSASLKEGDNVTFTCSGDIGADPQGVYTWRYYSLDSSNTDISSQSSTEAATYSDTSCSYSQVSSVVLQMRKEFDKIVVRCSVEQQGLGIDPRYRQTNQINVQYGPRTPTVSRQPFANEYYTGQSSLNLTCQADANPEPSFYWIVPDGNGTMMVDGPVYRFVNLTEDNTGNYTCMAYNTINLVNYTSSLSVDIVVSMTTTTSTTTPTTPSSTDNTGGGGNPGGSTGGDDDGGTNIATIVGPVVGAVVLIVIIVILVVVCRNKGMCGKRREEIEEPSEKPPSNNQGLTYYGNRPDLVTSDLKNNHNQNNLNSSFNSYDSASEIKSRNEDGLNYIDLQFDDKPRSRRPIQLVDNGSVGYADLDLPRV